MPGPGLEVVRVGPGQPFAAAWDLAGRNAGGNGR
jgi:hypothetical protein